MTRRMIGCYTLLQRHVTEHPAVLLIVSTQTSVLMQNTVEKKYQGRDFFRSLKSRALHLKPVPLN